MRLVKLSSNALLSFRLLTLLVHREAGCGHEIVEDACGDSHLVRTEISHRHDFACRKEAEHGSAIPMRRSKGRTHEAALVSGWVSPVSLSLR